MGVGVTPDGDTLLLLRMDEASSSDDLVDASGNVAALDVFGNPPVSAGLVDGARTFNGVTTYATSLPDAPTAAALLGEYTIEVQFKITNLSDYISVIAYVGDDSDNANGYRGSLYFLPDGKIQYWWAGGDAVLVTTATPLVVGVEMRVTVRVLINGADRDIEIYVDDALLESLTAVDAPFQGDDGYWWVGRDSVYATTGGAVEISELVFTDRALTTNEIFIRNALAVNGYTDAVATLSGDSVVVAGPNVDYVGDASVTAIATTVGLGGHVHDAASSVTATAATTGFGTHLRDGASAVSSTATASATAALFFEANALLLGVGQLTAAGTGLVDVAAALVGDASLSGAANLNLGGSASLLGTGDTDLQAQRLLNSQAGIGGEGTVTATLSGFQTGSASAVASAFTTAAAITFAQGIVTTFGGDPRLVNTAPGDDPTPIKPGQPIQMGFKSDNGEVQLGSAKIDMGLTGLVHSGVLPENNPKLEEKGLEISFQTSERRRPIVGTVTKALAGPSIVLTKNSNDIGELGVYEMKVRIPTNASVLARVKIRKQDWITHDPDWMNLDRMTGVHIGLEHGQFNTAANVFLRENAGLGEIVLAGPLAAYNGARPGQESSPFNWPGLTNGDQIEIFIYFNLFGKPSPFSPAYTPLVEVWTKTAADTKPVVQHVSVVGSLGQFPSPFTSSFPNNRLGPDTTATLFIGNIGLAGDVLQIDDWELYPDFRPGVLQGEQLPNHVFKAKPDAPVHFNARNGNLPTKDFPRWFKYSGAPSLTPDESFYYQPGRRTVPLYSSLTKPLSFQRMALERKEPRLESQTSGMMIEGFISGESTNNNGDSLAMGMALEDGEKSYRLYFLNDTITPTIGLAKDNNLLGVLDGFHVPESDGDSVEVDFRSLKFIRLLVDRFREEVSVFVEDEDFPLMTKSLDTDTFPDSSTPEGKVFFGHLDGVQSAGKFNFAFLNYLTQYYSWEGLDGLVPADGNIDEAVRFSPIFNGAGSVSVVDEALVLTKSDFNVADTYGHYLKTQDFSHNSGLQIDFRVKVSHYDSQNGDRNGPKTDSGVGVRIYFGTKILHLGFYDCGIHGQKLAILPGSGSETDIIEQTELGRQFSVNASFFEYETYRLVYQAFEKIEVWVGSVRNRPALTIPWSSDVGGFDLPLDTAPTQPPAVAFGHFNAFSGSVSNWKFFRWGRSNGYDVLMEQKYNELPSYLFGGRSLILSEFENVSINDADAPTFAGTNAATPTSPNSILLSWVLGFDDSDTSAEVVYDIFAATESTEYDFENPLFTTPPGASTFEVQGLDPATEYFFVVRARDTAGNIDTNQAEISATTPSGPVVTGAAVLDGESTLAGVMAGNFGGSAGLGGDSTVSGAMAASYAGGAGLMGDSTVDADGDVSNDPPYVGADFNWTFAGDDRTTRIASAVVTLSPTEVMFIGGDSFAAGGVTVNVDVWNIAGTRTAKANLPSRRCCMENQAAVFVGTSDVMVVGGRDQFAAGLNLASIYNYSGNSWANVLAYPGGIVERGSLIALNDGRMLFTGGHIPLTNTKKNTAYTYDRGANTWTAQPNMSMARGDHLAVKLADGRVLIAGGGDFPGPSTYEIFDPVTNTWSTAASAPSSGISDNATLLSDGRVLTAVFDNYAIYDPVGNSWTSGSVGLGQSPGHYSIYMAVDVGAGVDEAICIDSQGAVSRFIVATDTWEDMGFIPLSVGDTTTQYTAQFGTGPTLLVHYYNQLKTVINIQSP